MWNAEELFSSFAAASRRIRATSARVLAWKASFFVVISRLRWFTIGPFFPDGVSCAAGTALEGVHEVVKDEVVGWTDGEDAVLVTTEDEEALGVGGWSVALGEVGFVVHRGSLQGSTDST